jgi:aspartyl protease family protein
MTQPAEIPSTLKIVAFWLIVAIALYLGFAWYQKEQARPKLMLTANQQTAVALESRGRHFVALVKLQGRDQEMLVDTGASVTSISQSLANKLKLQPVDSMVFQTANGTTVGDIVLANLEIPGLLTVSNLRVAVMKDMEGPGLLGMDVLRKVRMLQENGKLVLSLEAAFEPKN